MDVGVIGVGAMGKNHVRVYSELKPVENLYLFDLNTSAAQELAKKFDANLASGMDDLLDSVDAVSVCVPTQFHHNVACEVIQKNIPVLIEKPICLSSGEAADLVKKIPEDLVVGTLVRGDLGKCPRQQTPNHQNRHQAHQMLPSHPTPPYCPRSVHNTGVLYPAQPVFQ